MFREIFGAECVPFALEGGDAEVEAFFARVPTLWADAQCRFGTTLQNLKHLWAILALLVNMLVSIQWHGLFSIFVIFLQQLS